MRLRSTSPTSPHLYICTLYSTLWFVCLNFGNASEAHRPPHPLSCTPPTFTPVFLDRAYFVFHLLYHVYLNLGMLLRSTFRSTTPSTPPTTTSTTPPNQIPLLEEQCPWTMSTFFWVLLPKCFTSTALKIIMIKSKHVCSFCSKREHGVLQYFLFLQSGERNGSF